MPRDIVGRGHHRVALRRAERDRDHILRQMLAVTNAGVEPLRDDVDERALPDNLEVDLRISFNERRDHRRQHQIDRRRRRIDPQSPRRHVAHTPHAIQRVADIGHRGSDPGQQQLAGFGQRDAAGGAVHQPHAEPLLHVPQPLAETRDRDVLLDRGAPEIPRAGDGRERGEITEVEIAHCSI